MFKAFGASDVGLGFCFVSVDEKRWCFFLPNVLKSLDTDSRESDRWALCALLGDRHKWPGTQVHLQGILLSPWGDQLC